MNDKNTDLIDDDEDYISKSQIKREVNDITALGVELTELTDSQLKGIEMSDSLFNALMEYKRIRKHSALKRQRLYIGKLIRKEDWEGIQEHLRKLNEPLEQHNARFKEMENWRDRMIAESDKAVNDFIGEYHHADRQKLRQIVKNTIKEREKEPDKTPLNARKLFKYIREIIDNNEDSL
jgi:ribosome-associated protein